MCRRALGAGADVDLENDSEELERFYVGEDGDDIGAAEPFSRIHSWEHGFLFLFQKSKHIQRHPFRDLAPQRPRL